MILKILTQDHPVLRQVAKPVSKVTRGLATLADDMLETMYDANGVGLAAPQVGISKRVIVVDVGDGPIVLFNPEIIVKTGSNKDTEGCLSIPGIVGTVDRCTNIVVRGLVPGGRMVELQADGWLARTFQHEIDHLDGILFVDKATDVKPADSEQEGE